MLMRNYRFKGRYGPEWGSGGIFGLRYYNGTLYYTLAFEGEAHFLDVKAGDEAVYRYGMVGEQPTSGGDTYNAVETVDNLIYFGGWVHAPAVYREGRVLFVNKYSHVHYYDTEERKVGLLWKESLHHESKWAGEVGEILYDPANDRLLIAREDGHERLGVYALDRQTGSITPLLSEPSPKGTIVHDVAFFGVGSNFLGGVAKFGALNLVGNRWEFFEPGESVDGKPYVRPELGAMASAYNRAFAFVRGGIFSGNPYIGEEFSFYRLFDFPTFYAPFRVNVLNVGGGLLTAFNSLHDVSFGSERWGDFTNTVVGPTVLVYITPPSVRIVGVLGARATSIEKFDGNLLVATNSAPNTGEADATPFDTGNRDLVIMREDILRDRPPALSFSLPLRRGAEVFGGIPLDGYSEPRALFYLTGENRLRIHEYDLSLPPTGAEIETLELRAGKNIVDLSSFSGIVSFELEKGDAKGKVRLELR